jgi:hypothetical protein
MEGVNAVGRASARAVVRGRWRAFARAAAVAVCLSLASACGGVTENASAVTCETGGKQGSGRGGAPSPDDTAGSSTAVVPDEVIVLPCTICARAENCCKAEGLTDCSYAAACAAASPSQQNQFYLPLCHAMLAKPRHGGKKLSDACGS